MTLPPRWPHQQRALDETLAAIDAGENAICVTAPTGGGKSRVMFDMLGVAQERGWPAALFTNRRLLFDQLAANLEKHGIDAGKRASGHRQSLLKDVQICMAQSEASQVYKHERRELHDAKLVLVDEAHLQRSGAMERIINDYKARGSHVIGYTATPLEIGHLYNKLIVAATMSAARKCGALLPAYIYGPDEPDLRHVGPVRIGEDLTESQNVKAMMRPGIFGRVFDWWKRLNPDARPTILFAPGVKESIYFAEDFVKRGVHAAHVDGEDTWLDGEFLQGDGAREHVLQLVRTGEVPIICNRFVLREGIDMPELYHCILACVMGSLTTYLQSVGRVLRNHPSMKHVILQDHSGSWWRHGSPNSDREWSLEQTNRSVAEERARKLREKEDQEPIKCPECGQIRLSGRQCTSCGFVAHKKSRIVVQENGELREMRGDIFKPRKTTEQDDTFKKWKSIYFGGLKSEQTFNQRYSLFYHRHRYYPPKSLPFMPIKEVDWHRKVKDVPRDSLHQPGVMADGQ